MFTYRKSLRSRIRHLPNWVFVTFIGALGAGLVLLLLLGNSPPPSLSTGPTASSSSLPSVTPTSLVPSANDNPQPSYVAPLPSAGHKTFIRVNQLSVNSTSTTDKTAPLTLSIFVSVVPGFDLGAGEPAFSLNLEDGSTSAGKPRASVTEGSYWVDFTVSADTASGTLVVSDSAGQNVLLSQVLAWPLLS
jgi:hypothetical protein